MSNHSASASVRKQSAFRTWLTAPVATSAFQSRIQQMHRSWLKFRTNSSAMFGLFVVLLLIFVAIFAPYIATYDIYSSDLANRLQPPSWQHYFGTDELGRDIYSRLIFGSRITLYIVTLTAVIAAPIGLIVGTTAGYMGGWVDTALMRIVDIQLSFPAILLALILLAILGKGVDKVIIALIAVQWAYFARAARAAAIVERNKEYVEAAQSMSLPWTRILWRHIFPNCIPPLMVIATIDLAHAIALEATLSFLGVGVPVTEPSLGMLISNGFEFLLSGYYWISFFPGIALALIVIAINLVGDHLRDILNPRNDLQQGGSR